ncbi:hypothetical protein QBZ16_002660 [Prototheca wickerhamii]|uniref:Protein kinase domain-containing protein n=1 Tax=Prototheca wickerhamii TaxID=3111 RepID=A0AAD9IKP7_PROWI|nr:hypothetical protein QBZ16_002660 [Prototheca wickerhamii]
MSEVPWAAGSWPGPSHREVPDWAPARRTAAVYPGPQAFPGSSDVSPMYHEAHDPLGKASLLVGRPDSPIGLATSAGCWHSSVTTVTVGGGSGHLAAAARRPRRARAGLDRAFSAQARLPILNKAGRVVGYRQDSSRLAWAARCGGSSDAERSAPSTPSSASCSGAFSSSTLETAAPRRRWPASPRPRRRWSRALRRRGGEPHRGFPDAANRLPGYVLGPVAGRGGFCTVRRALHEATGAEVAIKVIEKARLRDAADRERVEREVRVMRSLNNHVSIVRVLESAETRDCIYVVMEHCAGGSLLDRVRERRALPEAEARLVLQQLLAALAACHAAGVVHRDIKLENILFDAEGGVQLIDFGLCGFFGPGQLLKCHCGSPSYAAPEIVGRREYLAPPVDVWSLGVDLLAGMLTVDPARRLTLAQCAAHPWTREAPRWVPAGVGRGGLLRVPGDEATGTPLPDPAVLGAARRALGLDPAELGRAVLAREASPLAATYFLLAGLAGQGALARWERRRLRAAAPRPREGASDSEGGRPSAALAIPHARRHSQSNPDLKSKFGASLAAPEGQLALAAQARTRAGEPLDFAAKAPRSLPTRAAAPAGAPFSIPAWNSPPAVFDRLPGWQPCHLATQQ